MPRTLRIGMHGRDVELLQKLLTRLGDYDGLMDGDFGRGTESAVKAFQRRNFGERNDDGIVGDMTWDQLASWTGEDLDGVESPDDDERGVRSERATEEAPSAAPIPDAVLLEYGRDWMRYFKEQADELAAKLIDMDETWWEELLLDQTHIDRRDFDNVGDYMDTFEDARGVFDDVKGVVVGLIEGAIFAPPVLIAEALAATVISVVDAWVRVAQMPKRDLVYEEFAISLTAAVAQTFPPEPEGMIESAVRQRAMLVATGLSESHHDAVVAPLLYRKFGTDEVNANWDRYRRDWSSLRQAAALHFDLALMD